MDKPKISGFSYVRNGFRFGYPFLESILSALPVCDEWVVAVGDSEDGTREAIENLGSPKIRIIDTLWDENNREGGREFARQCDLALAETTGDWLLHLQADEVLHEDDLRYIPELVEKFNPVPRVEALLFDFFHFWGDYKYIRVSRGVPRMEIRLMRNQPGLGAYLDSQGFRVFRSHTERGKGKGRKLRVKQAGIPVYHYNYVRHPVDMQRKMVGFHRYWHDDDWLKKHDGQETFDYSRVDELALFNGTHPKVMQGTIARQNWIFERDINILNYSLKDRFLRWVEHRSGYRLFEYKNYRKI